ncbi:SAM-dependent chlorinase/fluorinase [Candidatus Electronema halotolerans]
MNAVFQPANCISLLTDFGLEDVYVGQMKGTILSRNPTARIVDLCHAIPCQDVQAAALMLQASWQFFPAGTVHLTVVDPGVGSDRRILAALSAEHLFIAPDNGLLYPLLEDGTIRQVRFLDNPALAAATISPTFHGRDIMAPAAARLAGGFPFAKVGPAIKHAVCVHLHLPKPVLKEGCLQGQILARDHFGNLRSNISKADLHTFAPLAELLVHICGQQLPLSRAYTNAPPGTLLALIDSVGCLEIAVNQGSAAEVLACAAGEPVTVRRTASAFSLERL